MNERIRELAIQTCDQIEWDGPNTPIESFTFTPQMMEKFAELIVRECASVGYDASYYESAMNVSNKILEHFGVEE